MLALIPFEGEGPGVRVLRYIAILAGFFQLE
jgi:hypothetical protein